MKELAVRSICIILLTALCGCASTSKPDTMDLPEGNAPENTSATEDAIPKKSGAEPAKQVEQNADEAYTADTRIADVINDPVFGDYGRLIFPVNEGYYSGDILGELQLTWYSNIDPDKTVEITNYMKSHAQEGGTIFYDIYTDEEKAVDPDKEDTGLFFFKGNEGAPFAVCNAGGGFAYVGAMHDSFPHALELSKKATTHLL